MTDKQGIKHNLLILRRDGIPGFFVCMSDQCKEPISVYRGDIIGWEEPKVIPNVFQDVVDFHKKYGIQYDGPPRRLPKDVEVFRDARLVEELEEIQDAYVHQDMTGVLDGFVDLIYIALGTLHLHGYDFNEAWKRVQQANMSKERASNKNPGKYQKLGCNQDIVKPLGWVAPDLKDLV